MALAPRALAAACAVLALSVANLARAEVERVVLIDVPAGVEAAVRTALEPWHIELIVIGPPTPGPSMPSSAERARVTASERGAGAVVWLADDGSGAALWIFDAESARTTARQLEARPPFDEPTAAAVALSVKTLLRFSAVAPARERAVERGGEPRPTATRSPTWSLLARGGLRLRDSGDALVEPRLGLGARAQVPVGRFDVVVGVEARLGPGASIEQPGFVGHFSDLGLALRGGIEIGLGPVALTPSAGISLHATAIDGSLPARGIPTSAHRVNPSLDAAVLLSADVGRGLRVGLELEASALTRRQRYRVAGETVFEVPVAEAEVSVLVAVPLP